MFHNAHVEDHVSFCKLFIINYSTCNSLTSWSSLLDEGLTTLIISVAWSWHETELAGAAELLGNRNLQQDGAALFS